MTDVKKYKSVAISIDTYQRAKPIAEKNYMSMASFIRIYTDRDRFILFNVGHLFLLYVVCLFIQAHTYGIL